MHRRERPGDLQNVSEARYDGLGRLIESCHYVDTNTCAASGYVVSKREYDALGRLWKASNPVCAGSAEEWSETRYDALGQIGSVVENEIQTTDYTWNALDNLTCVEQGGQLRVFAYDQMGRLTSADNPETRVEAISSCSPQNAQRPLMKYTYDLADNLTSRTDTAGATIQYTPDLLNRVAQKSSADGTVIFTWDQDLAIAGQTATNYPKGRLSRVTFGTRVNTYRYDALGRHRSSEQAPGITTPFIFSYAHVPAGLEKVTYPSGRQVTTTWNRSGQPAGLNGYVIGAVKYAAHGAARELTLANGVKEEWRFNARLQPTCLTATGTAGELLRLTNEYTKSIGSDPCVAAGSDNNGNVLAQKLLVGSTPFNTAYTYDAYNRIVSAEETNGQMGWNQGWSYDAFGNRNQTASTLPVSIWAAPGYNAATNRIAGSGWGLQRCGKSDQHAVHDAGLQPGWAGEERYGSGRAGRSAPTFACSLIHSDQRRQRARHPNGIGAPDRASDSRLLADIESVGL